MATKISLNQQIEITQAMIAAGERELVEEIGICGADIAAEIAVLVFRAMWQARVCDPHAAGAS